MCESNGRCDQGTRVEYDERIFDLIGDLRRFKKQNKKNSVYSSEWVGGMNVVYADR